MKKIEFDKNLIIKKFNEGAESDIYYYNQDGKIVLLKYFKDKIELSDITIPITKETLLNKEKKIEIIESSRIFKDEIKILDKVYENNEFKAYTLQESKLTPADCFQKRKIKIQILKLLKNKIEMFNNNGVFLGDIHAKNILTTKDASKIELCDLDNLKIGDLDFDLNSMAVNEFNRHCSNKELIDSYAFNLFTICFLERVYEPYIFGYLKNKGLPKILDTKENREILDSILNLDNSYQKKYLIDHVK